MRILDAISRSMIHNQIRRANESVIGIRSYLDLKDCSEEKLSSFIKNAQSATDFLVGLGYPPTTTDDLGKEVKLAIRATKTHLALLDEFQPKIRMIKRQESFNALVNELLPMDLSKEDVNDLPKRLEERQRVLDQMIQNQEN